MGRYGAGLARGAVGEVDDCLVGKGVRGGGLEWGENGGKGGVVQDANDDNIAAGDGGREGGLEAGARRGEGLDLRAVGGAVPDGEGGRGVRLEEGCGEGGAHVADTDGGDGGHCDGWKCGLFGVIVMLLCMQCCCAMLSMRDAGCEDGEKMGMVWFLCSGVQDRIKTMIVIAQRCIPAKARCL